MNYQTKYFKFKNELKNINFYKDYLINEDSRIIFNIPKRKLNDQKSKILFSDEIILQIVNSMIRFYFLDEYF